MSSPDPQAAPPAALDTQRPLLFALAGLALVLALARSAGPGPLSAFLAIALLAGVPLLGAQLGGAAARVFFLASALGVWLAFRPQEAGLLTVPGMVLHRIAYFAVPPLVLGLALADHDRDRLRLGWAHLYAPAVVMGLGAIVHLFVRWEDPASEGEIRRAAMIYAGCYAVLIIVGLLLRMRTPDDGPRPVALDRASELEEQGRFALAAQVYERNGQIVQAAQAAEKAGDWARAARLYKRSGDEFNAGEMYYRARMPQEALACYESSGAVDAAARLCAQLGQLDRAVSMFERAGQAGGVVRTLEQAGRRPTPEQYRKAGMLDKAAEVYEEAGDWTRAADIYEHELEDPERAAKLHLQAGSFTQAGRLLESMGRKQEALEAYAVAPGGALDAARLLLAAGRRQQAADMLARLPPSSIDKLEDETTLTLVSRVMLETGRVDDAARILQGVKRKGAASGAVRLLLGRAFREKGLHELAEEELRAATSLPLEPADELEAVYLLGCVLEDARKYDEAAQVFHAILQKDLEYADVQERYKRVKPLASREYVRPEET
jgi:tetratricopeptide (TPR) repeat protein